MRDNYAVNNIQTAYIHLFLALFQEEVEDLPDLIRKLKEFSYYEPSTLNKIKAEKLIQLTPSILDPNFAFKKDNITGYLCHVIRDIVFHTGCICNTPYVMPESNNVPQHYKYLVDKKALYQSMKNKLTSILKN